MPGKIHRKSYRLALHDIFGETVTIAQGPRTEKERNVLLCAVIRGLLRRLSRERHPRFESIREAIKFTTKHFGTWIDEKGLDWADQATSGFVAHITDRDVKHAEKPQPLQLLAEWTEVVEEVGKLRSESELRKRLLKQEKLNAAQTDAVAGYWDPTDKIKSDLVEKILSTRHKISVSAVHKALAEAGKLRKPR